MVEWKQKGYIRDDVNGMAQADVSARTSARARACSSPPAAWEAADMRVELRLLPHAPRDEGHPPRATGSFGYGWHISSRSTKVPASAAFIDWMTNEDTAKAFFAAATSPPSRCRARS